MVSKTFPWHLEGYGAGSDDELINRAQRIECGLSERPMSIHIQDDFTVSWKIKPDLRDLAEIACMEFLRGLQEPAFEEIYLDKYELCSWRAIITCNKQHHAGTIQIGSAEERARLGMKMLTVPMGEDIKSCAGWIIQDVPNGKVVSTPACVSRKEYDLNTFLSSLPHLSVQGDALLHIRCRGCLSDILSRLKEHAVLANFTFIEFENDNLGMCIV